MLLDSNLIIYASQAAFADLRDFIAKRGPAVSVISVVEVLGYHSLSDVDRNLFEAFFATSKLLPISDAVIAQAVQLRQNHRMSLGDSLIAATAVVHGLTLLTHNVRDFANVPGLVIIDPLQ
ncbi:MAG: type II toxin-antitoxin system VapC family toxin [Pirellulales bacterium]|nr:type II toxin-antitoxin system VapC family toxin [Pirellulales bacterium]